MRCEQRIRVHPINRKLYGLIYVEYEKNKAPIKGLIFMLIAFLHYSAV